MQRLFTSFPSGAPGLALILLRLCAATSLVCQILSRHATPLSPLLYIAVGILSFTLLAGAMLPLVCVATAVLQVSLGEWPPSAAVAISVIHALALAFLGAGAYSVDAMRYGRRVVILPKIH